MIATMPEVWFTKFCVSQPLERLRIARQPPENLYRPAQGVKKKRIKIKKISVPSAFSVV
jgi:hypothetical protein